MKMAYVSQQQMLTRNKQFYSSYTKMIKNIIFIKESRRWDWNIQVTETYKLSGFLYN